MADLRTLQLVQPPGGGADAPVSWRDLIALQSNIQGAYDPLVKVLQGIRDGSLGGTGDNSVYQLTSEKDQNGGYAGISTVGKILASLIPDLSAVYAAVDANGRINLSALPFEFGWVRWHDTAGAITITGGGGTQTPTVIFQSGTTAGFYIQSLSRALADSNWFAHSIFRIAAPVGGLGTQQDQVHVLHSTTQWGFITIDNGAGPVRPDDCLTVFVGARA